MTRGSDTRGAYTRSNRMPIGRLTQRDLDLLGALHRAPHTASQLLRLGVTFAQPLRAERLARRRLQQLAAAGLVRRAPLWGLAGRGGAPNIYLLTPLGFRLLHGPGVLSPSKRFGAPPAVIRHRHTHALTDFLVHLFVAAHRCGARVEGFCRENSVRLTDGPDCICPDAAFQLVRDDGREFSYFVELDAGTERIASSKEADSWTRKLRVYESAQRASGVRFRVLVLTLTSARRPAHILDLARSRAENPFRSLIYAATLTTFLAEPEALSASLFRDHLGRPTALLPAVSRSRP